MGTYRFGVWSMHRRFGPWRWFTSKIYGLMKVFSEIVTGVSMDRKVRVGKRFHLIHAGMISIHPETVFGNDCGVMHNVTIGTNMGKGVPKIGNRVFIGAGACVLGDIRVQDGARIAANSLVITDIPADSVAIGVPAKVIPGIAGVVASQKPQRTHPQAVPGS